MPIQTVEAVHIAAGLAERLVACCKEETRRETCGLLFGYVEDEGITITDYRKIRNASSDAESEFVLDPEEWIAFLFDPGKNGSIVGIFHSHPAAPAIPSSADMLLQWEFPTYAIISLQSGGAGSSLRCYSPSPRSGWGEQAVMFHNGSDERRDPPDC